MSKEYMKWLMERFCLNKKNLSEDEANRIVDFHAREKRLMYYYKCPLCGSHHLTSKEPNEKQRLVFA